MDVSVVICAYTERRWLDLVAAVASVQRQTAPPLELILVVDHNEQLLTRARHELADVTVVANSGMRGLAGARNTGIDAATGEVIAFLDDDAAADASWLAELVNGYADEGVLGVGGSIIPAWRSGRPRWFPEEFDWVVGCTYRGAPRRGPVRNLIGASMSFRRQVFDVVGGFREGIGRVGTRPLGCEETELCIRAGRAWPEGRFLTVEAASVHHTVMPERARWSYFWSRCYAEGLSKAIVSGISGSGRALASERTYVTRALPQGVRLGVAQSLAGDPYGLVRAGAIVAGLAVTTAGYGRGSLARSTVDTLDTLDTAKADPQVRSAPTVLGGSAAPTKAGAT